MKLQRLLGALCAAFLWLSPAVAVEQGSYVIPDAGPKSMAVLVDSYFNPAFRALASCSWGTSAPANGPSGAPIAYQCWADTTSNPVVFKHYDGASWAIVGKLNTSTHVWTPSYQGTDLGTASIATTGTSAHTIPFLDGANTWSGVQSFSSGMLGLKGSSSGLGTLNAPAAASAYVWTLPAATGSLADLASTQTMSGKTLTAPTINGGTATALTGFGIRSTGSSFDARFAATEVLTADRTLTWVLGDTSRSITFGGNVSLGGAFTSAAAFTQAGAFATTLTSTAISNSTLPAGTHTLAGLDVVQNWTGLQGFASGNFALNGSTSGRLVLDTAAAAGTTTLKFPGASFDFTSSGGTGQVVRQSSAGAAFSVATLAASDLSNGVSGSGAVALVTSPAFTTPNLGTPSAVTLTNATGLPVTGHAAQAAYTFIGNATGSSAVPTAVDIGALTAKASPVATDEIMIRDNAASGAWKRSTVSSLASAGSVASIAGNTGAFTLANGIDNSTNQIQLTAARRTLPTKQVFPSGSGTYTTPANVLWIEVTFIGGAGGGGGGGSSTNTSGGAGGDTCFRASGAACTTPLYDAGGGSGGSLTGVGGAGGTITGSGTCDWSVVGGGGGGGASNANTGVFNAGGVGGSSSRGGGGISSQGSTGGAGATNSGGGGGGGGSSTSLSANAGGGGGSGATCHVIINSPAASYTYAVGAGGTAGVAGTNGSAAGAGGSGFIVVYEHYGT